MNNNNKSWNKIQKCILFYGMFFVLFIIITINIPFFIVIFIFIIFNKNNKNKIINLFKKNWFEECIWKKSLEEIKKYFIKLNNLQIKNKKILANKPKNDVSELNKMYWKFNEKKNQKNIKDDLIEEKLKYNEPDIKSRYEKPINKTSNYSYNWWKSIWDDYKSVVDSKDK